MTQPEARTLAPHSRGQVQEPADARLLSGEASNEVGIDLAFSHAELDNGLRIIVHEDASVRQVSLNLLYKVGSRNEEAGRTGLAHFFEHMMFNGSARFGPGLFDALMEAHGASNNAYTSKDVTVYQDWCPPEALRLVLELEADRMAALSIDPAMVESERGVVANERRRYMAEPESVLDEALYASAYLAHPYRWPILGWMSDIESWTQEDLEGFFARYYSPRNALLIVAGAVRADEVRELAEAAFGAIPSGPLPPPVHTIEPPQLGERRLAVSHPSELAQLQMGWHIPPSRHPDFWALSTLEKVLFQGQSSLSYKRLIESEIALDCSGGVDAQSLDPSLFTVRAHLRQGVSAARFEDELRSILDGLARDPLPEAQLAKARNQLRAELVRSLKTISGKADLIGAFEVFGEGAGEIREALGKYAAVTAEDVQRVAAEYLVTDNQTTVSLDPARVTTGLSLSSGEVAEALAARREQRAALDLEPAESAPPPALEVPEPDPEEVAAGFALPSSERFVLDNGLVVRLMERRQLPLVCSALCFEAGGITAPTGKEGLAPLVGRLLRKGTERYDEDALSALVDGVGGHLGVSTGKFHMTIVSEVLSEHSELALELMDQVARAPTFPEEPFAKLKRRSLDGIKNDRSAARSVIDRFFIGALLGTHALAAPTSGDEQSLAQLGLEDLRAHHAARIVPSNGTLIVVGDFEAESMRAQVEAAFGGWRAAPAPQLSIAPLPRLEASRVLAVDKPGSDEVVFEFGRLSLPRMDPDYTLVSLLNSLLGGRFTSRLNTRLRIEEGLTYGVSSGFLDLREASLFRVESFSAAETAERAVDLALEECRRFHEGGIDQEELDSARAYLRGQFPADIETPEQLAEWLLFFEQRGLDPSYIQQSFEAIEALTLDAANALIGRHFGLEALQFVIIGDPKATAFASKHGELTRLDLAASRFHPPYPLRA